MHTIISEFRSEQSDEHNQGVFIAGGCRAESEQSHHSKSNSRNCGRHSLLCLVFISIFIKSVISWHRNFRKFRILMFVPVLTVTSPLNYFLDVSAPSLGLQLGGKLSTRDSPLHAYSHFTGCHACRFVLFVVPLLCSIFVVTCRC